MCGISGIHHPGQKTETWRPILERMTAGLVHRGPDEDGFFWGPGVSLGMRRLRVIDPLGGSQPISNEDGSLHIVLNGEIYRFEALREDLQKRGHILKTRTDTEVVLHLYEEYGLDCLSHFDGMFAFALWDDRRQRLVLARDRFGIKPLYYTRVGAAGPLAFCSELNPLLGVPGVSKTIDPVALDHYFTLSYIPHPRSIYQGIRKLSPAHLLISENGRIEEKPYWDLPRRLESPAPEEAAHALDAAIASSVQAMMRSDVPVGAFLSGGLDSSTVVYHMARFTSHPVQTFSVRFAEKSFDEGNLARLTAERLGTEHHEIWASPDDLRVLPDMAFHFGEPFADASQIPTYLVSKLARERVTVALSGDGGDEMLGGYETYIASLMAGWAGRMPEALRRCLHRASCGIPASPDHVPWEYKLRKFLAGCRLGPLEHHASWRTIFAPEQKAGLYSPGFAAALAHEAADPVFHAWASFFEGPQKDRLLPYQYLDIKTYLTDNNLTKVDRMSMAHSLEVRIPFLDLRVALTALSLPAALRLRGMTTKVLLRRLMKGRLPEPVLKMRKRGFAVPLGYWFRGALREKVREWLRPERVAKTGLLEAQPIQELINRHQRGQANNSRQLWNLICFLAWFDQSQTTGPA